MCRLHKVEMEVKLLYCNTIHLSLYIFEYQHMYYVKYMVFKVDIPFTG